MHGFDEADRVTYVIDGDTVILENNERVRLTGINAPEADRYFYEESKELLKIIVENKIVFLERDITDRDQYGRLLRYLYAGYGQKKIFINLEMVKRGFANVFTMAPDVKYAQVLLEAERYARENELGLWKKSKYNFSDAGQKSTGDGKDMDDMYGLLIHINWDAEGDDRVNLNDEYVIIKNMTGFNINIGGWTIKDNATNIYEFEKYLFKNGTEIILYTGSGKNENGSFYWNSKVPVWNNDGDTLYLRDKKGLLVDIYSY